MSAYEIKNNIYWVGAVDWNLRNFHGYSTNRGSTYNSYLIIDEKVVLIDTVKAPFSKIMLDNISEIIDPSKIDIIISNHVEPDHSGAIPEVLKYAKNAVVYTSAPAGIKGLTMHYGELPLVEVKSGDTLSIGKRTLNFVQTPMVHWPDNLVTYIPEDNILFSNDAFGQHLACSERVDYRADMDQVFEEAKKYYANIVLPYSMQVKKALDVISTLEIDIIAPSHGIIWKKYISQIIDYYNSLVSHKKHDKAVVVFDSMWGNSAIIANAISDAFITSGVSVKMFNLSNSHNSDVITECMDAKYLAVGSSTLNNGIIPTVASFLCYLKGLNPKNIEYIAFGSFGWGGQSIGIIAKELDGMKYKPLTDNIAIQFVPKPEQLLEIKKLVKSKLTVSETKLIEEGN